MEAYAAAEAKAELEHPGELYRDILARSFRSLGERVGAPVSDEDAVTLASSVPDWPAFEDSHDALTLLRERFELIILSNVDRVSFAGSRARLGVEFTSVLTAEEIGSYKPSPRNFDALVAEVKATRDRPRKAAACRPEPVPRSRPGEASGASDGVDQPASRSPRLGRHTPAARRRDPGLGVPVDGSICDSRRS